MWCAAVSNEPPSRDVKSIHSAMHAPCVRGGFSRPTSFKNAHSRAAVIETLNEPEREVRRGTTLAHELIRLRAKRIAARFKQSLLTGLP